MKKISMHKLFFILLSILGVSVGLFVFTEARQKLGEAQKIENSVRGYKYQNSYNLFINELDSQISSTILKKNEETTENAQTEVKEFKQKCFNDNSLEKCNEFFELEKKIAANYNISMDNSKVKNYDFVEYTLSMDSTYDSKQEPTKVEGQEEKSSKTEQKYTNDFKLSNENKDYSYLDSNIFPNLIDNSIRYTQSQNQQTGESTYVTQGLYTALSNKIIGLGLGETTISDSTNLNTDIFIQNPDTVPSFTYSGTIKVYRIYRLSEELSTSIESSVPSEIEPFQAELIRKREEEREQAQQQQEQAQQQQQTQQQ